jgi:Ni,Fe-hydrogenase III large subunit
MVIRSRRQEAPVVEETTERPTYGIIVIDVFQTDLTEDELSDIKRIFEQIRRDLDSIVQGQP